MAWLSVQPEETAVIDQLHKDSDRAAAVIAGSMVENRLAATIKNRLLNDDTLVKNLFRPSGPLGSFSIKIDVGYLLGLFSKETWRELVTVKDIRNAFAHKLDVVDFTSERIRSLVANLKIVERHAVTPDSWDKGMSRYAEIGKPFKEMPFFGYPSVLDDLQDPRKRYIMSCQVFVYIISLAPQQQPTSPVF